MKLVLLYVIWGLVIQIAHSKSPIRLACQSDTIPSDSLTVNAIAFASNGAVFASTSDGVYRSTNNGDAWKLVAWSEDLEATNGIAVNSKGHVFVSAHSYGIHRSTDGGDTWIRVDTAYYRSWSGSVAINSRDHLFMSGSRGVEEFVFRSTDNGLSWTYEPETRYYTDRQIIVDNRDRLYVYTANGLLSSTDNGDHWMDFLPATKMRCFVQQKTSLAADSLGGIFTGCGFQDVYRTTDGGKIWTTLRVSTDSTLCINAMGVTRHGLVLAGLSTGGLMKSADRGDHWSSTSLQSSNNREVLCVATNSKGTIFVGTLLGGVFRSMDQGNTWKMINRGFVQRVTDPD